MIQKTLLLLFCVFCTLLGCAQEEHTFTEKELGIVDLYVQLSKLQETYPANSTAYQDTAQKILYLSGLTEQDYRDTITFFCEEPERWEAFYKEVQNRLNNDDAPPLTSQQ